MKGTHGLSSPALLASVLTCAMALTSTASLAASDTDVGGRRAPAKSAARATTATSLGALVSSISKTDGATLTTTSGTFVDIPGAFVNVTVGSGQRRGFHVTLSGTCAIDGAGAEEDVVVRVLVNGVEIAPGQTTLCEDISTDGLIPEGGQALQWVKGKVGPGGYNIKAQWHAESTATGFLRDMNFTVRVHQ